MDFTPILIVLSTVLSLGFTIFYVGKASISTKSTLEGLGHQLKQGIEDINDQLDPIIKANSRAMGAISHLSDDTKLEKSLDRRIGLDLMDQYGDIVEGISLVFPRVKELLDERPEVVTKLMPRLNTLISDPEARKRLNLDLSGKTSDLSRIWKDERD